MTAIGKSNQQRPSRQGNFVSSLKSEFSDKEYRHGYLGSFLESVIAVQIRSLRIQRNLSQSELASRMGVTQSTIARLEGGQGIPTAKTLLRLAEAFDVALNVRFVTFDNMLRDVSSFNPKRLRCRSYSSKGGA